MIQFKYILLIIAICIIYASCMKDDHVRDIFPFGCYVESTRNGELRKFNFGSFAFYDRVYYYDNPDGDSILSIRFVNRIKGKNVENISLKLAKAGQNFLRVYDLNEPDTLRKKFEFVFDERYLSKATYVLDSSYPNTLELTSVSEDKKQIQGKYDLRVVMIESDKEYHSSWAPDTIHHSKAMFWINYFE